MKIPLKFEEYYPDGIVRVYRYTLIKDGYSPLKIRWILGDWEMLMSSFNNNEKWIKIDMPEKTIRRDVELYAID